MIFSGGGLPSKIYTKSGTFHSQKMMAELLILRFRVTATKKRFVGHPVILTRLCSIGRLNFCDEKSDIEIFLIAFLCREYSTR